MFKNGRKISTQGGDLSIIMRTFHDEVSIESPRLLQPPRQFEPDQLPGSANHPGLNPEEAVLGLINVREDTGMKVYLSVSPSDKLSKLKDTVTQTL